MNEDPLLVASNTAHYRLAPGSPCIDIGDPGFVPEPNATDREGHARVLCGQVDMGAYEYGIGDFHRTFEISERIDGARISAEMENGVLTLHLPKAETARSRRIEVNAG